MREMRETCGKWWENVENVGNMWKKWGEVGENGETTENVKIIEQRIIMKVLFRKYILFD